MERYDIITHDIKCGDFVVKDGSFEIMPSVHSLNLLRFVCSVDGVSVEEKIGKMFDSILQLAELSLSFTGLSLQDSVKDWNLSKVCTLDPSRMVELLPED